MAHPINAHIQDVAEALRTALAEHAVAVVTAPPGAGKSTLLPLELLGTLAHGDKMLILEPRRLAARQIAERLAYNLGEPVGKTVGYRVRFENKVSPQTRIEVLTEGILTRRLVADPALEGVAMVVFDEFHERNLASDVALALTREAQQTIRPDLKMVIMSATMDTARICQSLQAPLVEMEHRAHRVDLVHTLQEDFNAASPPSQIAAAVARAVRMAHEKHQGDILAFLPGQAEIEACMGLLSGSMDNETMEAGTLDAGPLGSTHLCPLYGLLDHARQQEAIAPSRAGERKVVLATPIAETSLTIEGVRIVVDSGLYRKTAFNAQSGLNTLITARISMDMAIQRTGRAGRVADGVCYRLWSIATEHRMEACRKPEIVEADLAATCLDVCAWGGGEIAHLPWLTPPPPAQVAQATALLRQLGAITEAGAITPHGRRLAQLPCHPRMAQMLILAKGEEMKALAADVAALLEEKDPLAQHTQDSDLNNRLVLLRERRKAQRLQKGWRHIARIAAQYRSLVRVPEDNGSPYATHTGLLLALAYPERIAKAEPHGHGRFMMACGQAAFVEPRDDLAAYEWLAIGSLNAGSGRIFLASPFEPAHLQASPLLDLGPVAEGRLIRSRAHLSWDNKNGQLMARDEKRIGVLLLEAKPLPKVDRKEAIEVLCQAVQKQGTSMLNFDEGVQNLQRRVAAVAQWKPELLLPDLGTEAVLRHPQDWLAFYLEDAHGKLKTTTAELKKIDLEAALWTLLTWEQQQAVDSLAPTHIEVPTGSRIRVEYRQGAAQPILRVRLQECFGLARTPRVNGGTVPVLMELLSPGFKPVQLTQDLQSFWQHTYFEVRKELKRRYPKHAWPDNPLEAQAVRGVRRGNA